jgi:hypothetical protein
LPDAAPVEPITLPAPADYTVEGRGDLVERARTFRILEQERECPQSSEQVIVVCAPEDEERYRYRPAGPPPPTAMEELDQALHLKIGPVEGDPVQMPTLHGAPSVGVRARIRF